MLHISLLPIGSGMSRLMPPSSTFQFIHCHYMTDVFSPPNPNSLLARKNSIFGIRGASLTCCQWDERPHSKYSRDMERYTSLQQIGHRPSFVHDKPLRHERME